MQAVILSGGVGSRLWPVSNETRPKPFLILDDGQSLLQKVFLRATAMSFVTNIITVANKNFFSQIQDEYNKVDALRINPVTAQFILEPFGKNTAAAIAAAALQIQEYYDSNEVMLVLPADHLISDQQAFEEAVLKAKDLAVSGALVTFGIKPDNPEVGYGYIECDGNEVKNFVEKPNLKLAQKYLKQGNFLWNSGMFCFTAGSILREMEKHCPKILNNVRYSIYLSSSTNKNIELDSLAFSLVPEESIDYAVMEKSDCIAVVPCDIGWKDIGTWESLSKLVPADSEGNRVKGNATLHNVSNCYIENNGQLVGVVGVKDLAIISTKNGLLVIDKNNSEAARNIYFKLQKDISDIREFSWGKIQVIQDSQKINLNQLEVNPGASLDLAKYFQYTANWIVVRGEAQFLINNQLVNLTENESRYIPRENLARLTSIGSSPLVIITVQLDDYLSNHDMMALTEFDKVGSG